MAVKICTNRCNRCTYWSGLLAIICVVYLPLSQLWDKPAIKKDCPFIPGALVAVIVSVLINQVWLSTGSKLALERWTPPVVQIPVAYNASEFWFLHPCPISTVYLTAKCRVRYFFAVIASLETLLSIEAVDNIDPERRVTNTNKGTVCGRH